MKGVTKERILEEFKKCPDAAVPHTTEEMDKYIKDIVKSKEFVGKSIVFVFDRGRMDDMPRYLHLEYFLTKEDIYGGA
jgi:hypothetical protein